jgi:hypothetical protein
MKSVEITFGGDARSRALSVVGVTLQPDVLICDPPMDGASSPKLCVSTARRRRKWCWLIAEGWILRSLCDG